MGLSGIGSTSRRSQQRYWRRLLVVRDALLCLVATARLSGPSLSFCRRRSAAEFTRLLSVARRRAFSYPHVMRKFFNTSADIYSLPGWASCLHSSSRHSSTVSATAAWSHCLTYAKRFGRPDTSCDSSGDLETLDLGGYTQSKLEKLELLRPLDVDRVAIPSLPQAGVVDGLTSVAVV